MPLMELTAWAAWVLPCLLALVLALRLARQRQVASDLGWRLAAEESRRRSAESRQALAEERATLARDLHDELGHQLTHASLALGALEVSAPEDVPERAALAQRRLAEAVDALNRSVRDLRRPLPEPPMGDDVADARRRAQEQQRRTARLLWVLPAGVALLLLGLPAAGYLGQAALSWLPAEQWSRITVGMPRSEAQALLPRVEMGSPPPQRGAGECRHHEATFSPFDRDDVLEVCFVAGRVSSTTVIPAP